MPKILLINYTKSDAEVVGKATGLKVLRGYLSEVESYTEERNGTNRPTIKFYSPEPYYECVMTFISLPASEIVKKEFSGLATELSEDDRNGLLGYWHGSGQVLTIFIGDTNMSNLWSLGVPFKLKKSRANDTKAELRYKERDKLFPLVKMLGLQSDMPPSKYIVSPMPPDKDTERFFYSLNTRWYIYLTNKNGDYFACALSKNNSDYSGEEPGVIVTPRPKKLSTTTAKMIEFFGEYYDIYTPGADWQESDIFYPQAQLVELTKQIADIRTKAEGEVSVRQSLVEDHRTEWNFLRHLVAEQGQPLVDAVYKVLTDVLDLKVVKSDDETVGEPIEDLLVDLGQRKISLEVKGTTKPTPPLEYTQQPFQHLVRRGYGKEVEAGLVLNHDMKKDPKLRKLAYTDKDKVALIANLYFIDTRVLLEIAVAVIDMLLTKEDAVDLLFNTKGRIIFSPTSNNQN